MERMKKKDDVIAKGYIYPTLAMRNVRNTVQNQNVGKPVRLRARVVGWISRKMRITFVVLKT